MLVVLIVLGRRAEKAAYSQIEGQPGAVGAVLKSSLRRGWTASEMPVAVSPQTQDAVYRAVGRGGVVLIGEGPKSRTQQMLDESAARCTRILPNVPINFLYVGPDADSVPLHKLPASWASFKNALTKAEVLHGQQPADSLGKNGLPIPKGIDPTKVARTALRAEASRWSSVSAAPAPFRPAVVQSALVASQMSAGITRQSSTVRTSGRQRPTSRRSIGTTRIPSSRCPMLPLTSEMNRTCSTAKTPGWPRGRDAVLAEERAETGRRERPVDRERGESAPEPGDRARSGLREPEPLARPVAAARVWLRSPVQPMRAAPRNILETIATPSRNPRAYPRGLVAVCSHPPFQTLGVSLCPPHVQ